MSCRNHYSSDDRGQRTEISFFLSSVLCLLSSALWKRWWNFGFQILLFIIISTSYLHAANNFSSSANPAAIGPIKPPSKTLALGEHLAYEVFWMGMPIGLGELWVKEKVSLNGREAFHVVAVAETNKLLSKIYPVHDEVHSWIDVKTFQSLQFQKKVSEGHYRADEFVQYDAVKKTGYYQSLKNGTKKEFDITLPVQDILSAFYWARRQPLQIGKSFKTIVNSDEKDWSLEINVIRRETKELRGRDTLDTILIEPKTRLKGVLEKRGRVWIYLKNDPSRTPVWITFKTSFGSVVGVIQETSK